MEFAKNIKRDDVRECLTSFLMEPRMGLTSVDPKVPLEISPAAPRKHHMYRGGLLQHTLSVTLIALTLADIIEKVYGVRSDRDLVAAAAILHDIYKFYQYEFDENDWCFKPRRDWYFSHDYAIVAEAARRGCPEELLRVLSEVHGTVPITTIEGLIVHLADSVDAKLGEYLQDVVVNELKEIESSLGCKYTKLLWELVSKLGFNAVLEKALRGELKPLAKEICEQLLKS